MGAISRGGRPFCTKKQRELSFHVPAASTILTIGSRILVLVIKTHDQILSGGLLGKIRGQEHWAAFSFPLSGPVFPPGCRGGQRETGVRDVSALRA